jgi:hypothetical protein
MDTKGRQFCRFWIGPTICREGEPRKGNGTVQQKCEWAGQMTRGRASVDCGGERGYAKVPRKIDELTEAKAKNLNWAALDLQLGLEGGGV